MDEGVDKVSETESGVSAREEAVAGLGISVLTEVGLVRMGKSDLQIGSKNLMILLVSVLPSLMGTKMAASNKTIARPVYFFK